MERPVTLAAERRSAPRFERGDLGHLVHVRVKPGIDVRLLNLSARGLLIETTARLLPGTVVDLQIVNHGGVTTALRGRLVRCGVSALLPGEVRYHGAVELECDAPCLLGRRVEGAGIPGGNGPYPIGERDTPAAPATLMRPGQCRRLS